MPSYKIHSLKDNKKLSFIIEGNSSAAVEQKLSTEGYIVLSVEEVILDESMVFFSFEGRKQDNSFISGKISAENIFQAYEMLIKEYSYILDKLYPSNVSDPIEQEKIFHQLQYSFQREEIKKVEIKKDISQERVAKNKENIGKIIVYLESSPIQNKENIISELRKLEQLNNISTIEQTFKMIIQKIYTSLPDKKHIDESLKGAAKDLHVYLAPSYILTFKKWYQNMTLFFSPIVHKEKHEHISVQKNSTTLVLGESHINKLLRIEYRKSLIKGWFGKLSVGYFYTLFREKQSLFLLRKILKNIAKILSIVSVVVIACLVILTTGGYYNQFFFSGESLFFLGIILVASLVFPDRAV